MMTMNRGIFMKKTTLKLVIVFAILVISSIYFQKTAMATTIGDQILPASVNIDFGDPANPQTSSSALQLLLLVSILGLAPSLILAMTCFTRIIIALHFLRSALGTQQMPPNQIIVGLALAMTFFLMGGVITDINENAFQPYMRNEITQGEAIERGMLPIRGFMLRQVEKNDLTLFAGFTGETFEINDTPNHVLIPAFILGEITKGFRFGFLIYMPFIVIDMVVASVLMAMGMMMLPPAMISLPFKILLFIMVDGWNLTVKMLMSTFR